MTVSLVLLALLVIILWVMLVATSGELRAARVQAESVERSLRYGQQWGGKRDDEWLTDEEVPPPTQLPTPPVWFRR
ncbi:hypothetical protein [Arthrobacter sp. G119Y2]|uniref:hypothetical protein n=1 Tax=Arthrobacter sp. G119Y2 TaxID=3134965 RepID=UPI0031199659